MGCFSVLGIWGINLPALAGWGVVGGVLGSLREVLRTSWYVAAMGRLGEEGMIGRAT